MYAAITDELHRVTSPSIRTGNAPQRTKSGEVVVAKKDVIGSIS